MKKIIRFILVIAIIGVIVVVSAVSIHKKTINDLEANETDLSLVDRNNIELKFGQPTVLSDRVQFEFTLKNKTGGPITGLRDVYIELYDEENIKRCAGCFTEIVFESVIGNYGQETTEIYFVKNDCDYTFFTNNKDNYVELQWACSYTMDVTKSYGIYPQTKVTPTAENGLIHIEFDSTWTDYEYYREGSKDSFMYYKDVDLDSDGEYDYRGVYFTKPRYSSTETNTGSTLNGYNPNTVYWFKYEPIQWDVIGTSNGVLSQKTLLVSHYILDSQDFNYTTTSKSFLGFTTKAANNYKNSHIREWLNGPFINSQFMFASSERINNSENSVPNSRFNTCQTTEDNIFLLSYQQAYKYYPNDLVTQTKATDYAKCQGVAVYFDEENREYSCWWLRSGYQNNQAAYVSTGAYKEGEYEVELVSRTDIGIRPACWVLDR